MEFFNRFFSSYRNTIFNPTGGGGGGGREGIVQPPLSPPPMTTTDFGSIDVDDDDEVVILSPGSFAQAMRNREGTAINTAERPQPSNDGCADEASTSRYNMRKRPSTSDRRSNSKKKHAMKPVVTPQPAPPNPPPKEPAFSCPICMSSLVEATSTKCGHIFCKHCIKSALSAQSKCPTCRKKLSLKDIIRVYLPATEMS